MYQHKKPLCTFPGCDKRGGTTRSPFCVAHYGKEKEAKFISENECKSLGCYFPITHKIEAFPYNVCEKHYLKDIEDKKRDDAIWEKGEKERINGMDASPEKDWLKKRTKMHEKLMVVYYMHKYKKKNPLRQMIYGEWEKEPFIVYLREELPDKVAITNWCKALDDEDEKELFRGIYKEAFHGIIQKTTDNQNRAGVK